MGHTFLWGSVRGVHNDITHANEKARRFSRRAFDSKRNKVGG